MANMPDILADYVAEIAHGVAWTWFPFPGFDKSHTYAWTGYNPSEGLEYEWPDGQTITYRRPNWRNYSQLDCPIVLRNIRPSEPDDVDWGKAEVLDSGQEVRRVTSVEVPANSTFTKTITIKRTHSENAQNKIVAGLEASFEEHLGSQYKTNFSATLKQTVNFSYERQWGSTDTQEDTVTDTFTYEAVDYDRRFTINAVTSTEKLRSVVSMLPTFEFIIDFYTPALSDGRLYSDGHLIAKQNTWNSKAEMLSVMKGEAPDSITWGKLARGLDKLKYPNYLKAAAHQLEQWKPTEAMTYVAELNNVVDERLTNQLEQK